MKYLRYFALILVGHGIFGASICEAAQYVLLTPARAYINNNNGIYLQIVPVEPVVNIAGCASVDSYVLHDPTTANSGLRLL